MAKLLAIEWDDREARVAVASPRGSEMVVEEAFAIDIAAVAGGGRRRTMLRAVGRRIAEVLAQRGLTGSDALVGLGRTSIELRSLSLPPAPPEELPDLVRFQAMQAFTTIGEDWPLDFVELGTQDDVAQCPGRRRVAQAGRADSAGVRGQPAQAALPGAATVRRRVAAQSQPACWPPDATP